MCTSSLIDAGIDPTGKIASRCDQLHGIRALAVFSWKVLLLVAEIPFPTTWDVVKNPVNSLINYQPQLVNPGF